MNFVGVAFFGEAVGEDGRIDDDRSDDGAVTGKHACGLDTFVGLGHGPKRDVVDFTRSAFAAGVVVTATFGERGTI